MVRYCLECGSDKVRLRRMFCSKKCYGIYKSKTAELISKADLIEAYSVQKKTLVEVAKIYNTTTGTVRRYLEKYDIHNRGNVTDYSGHVIGQLTVLYMEPEYEKYKHRRWKCICSCGNECTVNSLALSTSKNITCLQCKSKRKRYTGLIANYLYSRWKHRAGKRHLDFTISKEYLENIFYSQNGKCAISGVDIYFAKTSKKCSTSESTASLDRIDSSKGYIEGNVQWVHKIVNIMKSSHSDEEFINWCNIITSYNKGNKNESV